MHILAALLASFIKATRLTVVENDFFRRSFLASRRLFAFSRNGEKEADLETFRTLF